MKTIIIFLLATNTNFTIDSKLELYRINFTNKINNCFSTIDEVRNKIAVFDKKTNKWLLKDGRQFVGGMCE